MRSWRWVLFGERSVPVRQATYALRHVGSDCVNAGRSAVIKVDLINDWVAPLPGTYCCSECSNGVQVVWL